MGEAATDLSAQRRSWGAREAQRRRLLGEAKTSEDK